MPGARIARLHPWANAPFRPAPTITSQPSNASVSAGATANFSVTASDALSYQWQEYVEATPVVVADEYRFHDLGTSASPSAISVDVPTGALAVVVHVVGSSDGASPVNVTGVSSDFTSTFTRVDEPGSLTAVYGCVAWAKITSPGVGKSLTITFGGANTLSGASATLYFLKDVNPDDFELSADTAASADGTTAATASVTSVSTGLVIARDVRIDVTNTAVYPSNESGWTSLTTGLTTQTYTNASRLRKLTTPTTGTVTATTQDTYGSMVTVISIKGRAWVNVSAGSGGTTSSYTTATTVLGDSGRIYRCLVTGYGGQTASNSVTLTVTSGGGGLTISPSLLTRSKTIYGPTLTRGAVSIAPVLLTRSKTLYGPTVARGAVSVAAPLLTRSKTIIAPTVVPGVVSVAPALLTRIKVAYAPTLTVGSVTVAPPLLTRSKTIYEPVVSQASGAQTIIAPLLTRSKTVYGPTILRGAVTVAPPLLTRSKTLYGPTVTVGALTIVPPLLTRSKTILFPTVSGGEAPASAGGLLLPVIRRRKR